MVVGWLLVGTTLLTTLFSRLDEQILTLTPCGHRMCSQSPKSKEMASAPNVCSPSHPLAQLHEPVAKSIANKVHPDFDFCLRSSGNRVDVHRLPGTQTMGT
jgi:hypothetical protein